MKSTKLLTTLFATFSLFSCATIPKPDADIGIVNAPGKKVKYYNIAKDYDDSGNLKAGAVPKYRPFEKLEDLNKRMCFDSDAGPEEAIARMLAWTKKLREAYDRGCKPPAR